jgi:hypothetical protein
LKDNKKTDSEQEYWQLRASVLELITSRMDRISQEDIGISGFIEIPENASRERRFELVLEHFSNGLKNPEKIKDLFLIEVKDEVIYHVAEGRVLEDKLSLANHYKQDNKESFESQIRDFVNKNASETIVEDITDLIQTTRGLHGDEKMEFETKNYNFSLQHNSLSVTKKNGEEILNNQGFTQAASREDIAKMLDLGIKIRTVQDGSFTPRESPSPKLKP